MKQATLKNACATGFLLAAIMLTFSIVHAQETDNQKAIDALLTATADIEEMQRLNLTTTLENDILTEARKEIYGENYTELKLRAESINQTEQKEKIKEIIQTLQTVMQNRKVDYNLVISKAEQIRALKLRAYSVSDQLSSLKLKMNGVDPAINITEERKMQAEAEALFKDELYDDAENKIKDTFNAVNKKEAQSTELRLLYTVGKESVVNYIKTNWKALIAELIGALLIGSLLYWRISISLTKRKIRNLELEKQVLVKLMIEAQQERFAKGSITKEDYEILMQAYKERTIDIDKELPIVKQKIAKDVSTRTKLFGIIKNPAIFIANAASYVTNLPKEALMKIRESLARKKIKRLEKSRAKPTQHKHVFKNALHKLKVQFYSIREKFREQLHRKRQRKKYAMKEVLRLPKIKKSHNPFKGWLKKIKENTLQASNKLKKILAKGLHRSNPGKVLIPPKIVLQVHKKRMRGRRNK